jgi:predicted dehydrogenase
VRVVVVGTGFGRRVVAPAFAAVAGCKVVEVVSGRDREAVARACGRADVDLVSVHSPPFLHAEHVRFALDAGHAVLCDKPLGRNAAEAEELLAAAHDAGTLHACNFEFRFDPGRRRLRDLLAAGRIGDVEHVLWVHRSSGTTIPPRPYGWLFDGERGGGWVGAWASHAVDALQWMLGPVVDVAGRRTLAVPERPDLDGISRRCTAEDGLAARLRLEAGATVTIDSTFAAAATLAPRIVVTGTGGSVESVADRLIDIRDPDGRRITREDVAAAEGDRHDAGMRACAQAVAAAVAGDSPPDRDLATFADAAAVAQVLDRLRALPLEAGS